MNFVDWIIAVMEAFGAVAAVAALVMLLVRRRRFPPATWALIVAIVSAFVLLGTGNVLEWSRISPYGDVPEDFVMPVVPVLWLFLFVVELGRVNRQQLRANYDQLKAVHDLTTSLTVTMEPRSVMQDVVAMAARLLEAPLAVVFVPDERGTHLRVGAAHGLESQEYGDLALPLVEGSGLSTAFLQQQPFCTSDVASVAIGSSSGIFSRLGVTTLVDVPLVYAGQSLAVLSVARAGGTPFTHDDVALLKTLGTYAATALHNTGLYNRVVESEAKYRVLVENAQIAIVTVDDATQHIFFWNRGCERLFGWPAGEAIGRHISLLHTPDQWERFRQEVVPQLKRDGYWFGEFPAIRKDGSPFTTFFSLSRVYDAAGRALCTLGFCLDATEQVQLREQLLQAQKMETLGTLAGGIAHDFNNLLTGILGFASLLRPAFPPDDENTAALVQIEDAAQRGSQLVRQLLTFSHKQPMTLEPVQLNTLVDETAALIRRTFPGTVRFAAHLDPNLPAIQADAIQMHQILMNLAVNARDAMPGGGDLTLTTENLHLDPDDAHALGLRPGPYVRLSVTDTGTGISEADRRRVFEPFYTTKPKGTGLGLSTVYAIVSRHGGRVTLTTEPGCGTTFHITLPVRQTENAPAAP